MMGYLADITIAAIGDKYYLYQLLGSSAGIVFMLALYTYMCNFYETKKQRNRALLIRAFIVAFFVDYSIAITHYEDDSITNFTQFITSMI